MNECCKMKIIIIGGTGVIGYKILKIFEDRDMKFTYFNNSSSVHNGKFLDITNQDLTISFIKEQSPEVIVNASSYTNMDLCESNKKTAYKTNVTGLENIISGAKITHSKVIQISTSAVFNGEKPIYFEDDETCPISYYGLTKSIAEKSLQESDLSYLILRTDQPYCWNEKWQHTNSVIRAIETLKNGKQLNEIIDWYNSPTYVPDFVNATMRLIELKKEGIFHVSGSDFLNRYDWALLTAQIFQLDPNLIKPINSSSLNLSAKRVNGNLNNKKLFRETGIRMMGVKEGLSEMFKAKNVSYN